MARNLTIKLDDETAQKMEKYSEVNWSEVARKAINNYIVDRDAQVRHEAALKAHDTRRIKKRVRHDAAIKAHVTRGTYQKE